MKWCLSGRQTDEYIKKADEIKLVWMDHNKELDIIGLLEINPNARILIFPSFETILVDKDYQWLKSQCMICKRNFAVIVSYDDMAQRCKDLDIPFFFGYPARTFQQLNRMHAWGATDAYIDDMLCHSLDSISEFYSDMNIRVYANSCGWGTADGIWEGTEGSWFRPEDLWQIQGIDVAEFHTSAENIMDARKQEQALYRIYAEKHEWHGYVNDFVFDLKKKDVLNRLLDFDFQERRSNCRMRCMETHRCRHCDFHCNMATEIQANKIKENINNG